MITGVRVAKNISICVQYQICLRGYGSNPIVTVIANIRSNSKTPDCARVWILYTFRFQPNRCRKPVVL
jgi:hypothetical protein